MKKTTIILIVIQFLIINKAFAQFNSIFDNNQTAWKLNNCGLMSSCFEDSLVLKQGDTIINGKTYKKLGYFISINPNTTQEDDEYYVREELTTGKIWTISNFNSTEMLICDLTLNVNDTFDFGIANGKHRVDSVYYKNNKKVIRFDYDIFYQQNFIDKLKMIEGVGLNIGGCIEPQFNQLDLGNYVICQEKNYFSNYSGNHPTFNCSSPVSLKEFTYIKTLEIFPNPAKDKLFLNLKGSIIQALGIVSVDGKLIKQFSSITNELDISFLTEGVYFLRIKTNNKVSFQKFIVSN